MSLPTLMVRGNLRSPLLSDVDLDPDMKEELRTQVPIDYIHNWFKTRLYRTGLNNRVLVLLSETASGKSTALPPMLYRRFVHGSGGPGLICSQPRILTSIENIFEMLKHNSDILRLGKTVGWSTQYNKMKPDKTSLLSATIGTLAQQLKVMTDKELMARYRFILIDEVHERDLQTDFTIYMLKNFLNRVKDKQECPFVVLMSATFDPDPMLKYFDVPRLTNFIWCAGATAKIDEMWDYAESIKTQSYIHAAAGCVETICRNGSADTPNKCDVLIFLPGGGEMTQVKTLLDKINEKLTDEGLGTFSVLIIDSNAVNYYTLDYKKLIYIGLEDQPVTINGKQYTPQRRVIMSTNVAETGLTLDGLKYVIDAGYNRETEYNPVYGTTALLTKPAPRSRVRQRRGRSGRKFPGVFYPLYTKSMHDKLQMLQFPQILTSDISTIMLDIVKEQLKVKKAKNEELEFKITDIDMVDQPTPDALTMGLNKLRMLGYVSFESVNTVDAEDIKASYLDPNVEKPTVVAKFGLTALGLLASTLGSMEPEITRMILASYAWDIAAVDLISIAVYLQLEGEKGIAVLNEGTKVIPGINWRNVYKQTMGSYFTEESLLYKVRLLIADNFIDGLFLMNALIRVCSRPELFMSITSLRNWCGDNNIKYDRAVKMLQKRDEMIEMFLVEGFNVFNAPQLIDQPEHKFMHHINMLKHCIYDGFRCNLIKLKGSDYYAGDLKIKTPSLFREDEKSKDEQKYKYAVEVLPTTLVYYKLDLKLNRKTNIFAASTKITSTLDGYIPVDDEF